MELNVFHQFQIVSPILQQLNAQVVLQDFHCLVLEVNVKLHHHQLFKIVMFILQILSVLPALKISHYLAEILNV